VTAAAEIADVKSPGGQRTLSHSGMHAKLLNYIGQVFECKADNPHLFSQDITS